MDQNHCRMDSRPSLSMLQLHLLVMFLAGVIMSSWVWTSSTVDTWRRCVRRYGTMSLCKTTKLEYGNMILVHAMPYPSVFES